MRIEAQELVQAFYKTLDTDLPFDAIKDICYSPFNFVKSIFENGKLESVRLKYFGVFYVPVARAKRLLNDAEIRYQKNIITEERYLAIHKSITEYLKRCETEVIEEEDE
jgi:hypothetical protein